jgi:hypothetical protein
MSIEIRQLNIKSNVLQSEEGTENTAASAASKQSHSGAGASACAGPQLLTEEARAELMTDCKAMLLDLLSRARER